MNKKRLRRVIGYVTLYISIVGFSLLYASEYDSLNVRFVGNWSYGYSWAVSANITSSPPLIFSGSGGAVQILDLNTLQKISDIRTRGRVMKIVSDWFNGILYIAADGGGIEIWNVSDPYNPVRLSRYWTPGHCYGLYIYPNSSILYAALEKGALSSDYHPGKLLILDVSDLSNPIEIGSFFLDSLYYFRDVVVPPPGTLAYVAGYYYDPPGLPEPYLSIINVSNPSNPVLVSHIRLWQSGEASMVPWRILISDTIAYIPTVGFLDSGWVYMVDVSDPSSPQIISKVGGGDYTGAALSGSNYLFAARAEQLITMDVSDPSNPVILNDTTGIPAFDVYQMGYIYTAAQNNGTYLVYAPDPSSPTVMGKYDFHGATGELSAGLFIKDSFAYLSYDSKLVILDISDLSNPVDISSYEDTLFSPMDIYVSDSFAYVAGDTSFQIIDVSDPSNPQKIGEYVAPYLNESFISIDVSGNYAYLGTENFGLRVMDISDPSNIQEVGYYIPIYQGLKVFRDLKIIGQYVYIADWDYGLRIVDVSDPSNPVQAGELALPSTMYGIYIKGNYAYLAGSTGGVYVVDISDPANPALITQFSQTQAWAIHGTGDYIYVSNGYDGISAINISNPVSPQLTGYYETPWFVNGVFAREQQIFVTNGYGQSAFQIYENLLTDVKEGDESENPELSLFFYPFKKQVRFQLFSSGNVSLKIFDAAGRRLYKFQRNLSSGTHNISLNEIKKGIYFYYLKTGRKTKKGKLIFLR